ncbi:MAG: RnfH family protein [Gammaproteobacteria bacterium]|nr:RnfH family protein [Gammaproteobacteria bacterium]MDE2023457.1 RnfH family protein [Gammaproteobacteria bacterium]
MPSPQTLHIEVVYPHRDRQCVVMLDVAAGTTARAAVRLSGLQQRFPEIAATDCQLGIFGRPVAAQRLLRDGDRVEIYRPLQVDPKQARRRRARGQR